MGRPKMVLGPRWPALTPVKRDKIAFDVHQRLILCLTVNKDKRITESYFFCGHHPLLDRMLKMYPLSADKIALYQQPDGVQCLLAEKSRGAHKAHVYSKIASQFLSIILALSKNQYDDARVQFDSLQSEYAAIEKAYTEIKPKKDFVALHRGKTYADLFRGAFEKLEGLVNDPTTPVDDVPNAPVTTLDSVEALATPEQMRQLQALQDALAALSDTDGSSSDEDNDSDEDRDADEEVDVESYDNKLGNHTTTTTTITDSPPRGAKRPFPFGKDLSLFGPAAQRPKTTPANAKNTLNPEDIFRWFEALVNVDSPTLSSFLAPSENSRIFLVALRQLKFLGASLPKEDGLRLVSLAEVLERKWDAKPDSPSPLCCQFLSKMLVMYFKRHFPAATEQKQAVFQAAYLGAESRYKTLCKGFKQQKRASPFFSNDSQWAVLKRFWRDRINKYHREDSHATKKAAGRREAKIV